MNSIKVYINITSQNNKKLFQYYENEKTQTTNISVVATHALCWLSDTYRYKHAIDNFN